MKTAHTPNGKPIVAAPSAPARAICPYCGDELTLRSRKTMNNGDRTYFWRHRSNSNRHCAGRNRPIQM